MAFAEADGPAVVDFVRGWAPRRPQSGIKLYGSWHK